jgi:hypothetical protein
LLSYETMALFDLVLFLVIGVGSGAILRAITRGSTAWTVLGGLFGFAGAFLGTAFARLVTIPDLAMLHVSGRALPIVSSLGGAILLVVWCITAQVMVSRRTA